MKTKRTLRAGLFPARPDFVRCWIDFDAVLHDPNHPSQLLPKVASKEHLHLDDEGYKAMADSIDLALFK